MFDFIFKKKRETIAEVDESKVRERIDSAVDSFLSSMERLEKYNTNANLMKRNKCAQRVLDECLNLAQVRRAAKSVQR